jgi:GAF domain-containing protein
MNWEPGDAPLPARDGAESITASVAEVQNVLLGTESIEEFLHELAVQAAGLIPGSLSCGITVTRQRQPTTMACSDEVAAQLNDLQYQLGEGPCLAALKAAAAVAIDDMDAEGRWPGFTRQAAAHGIGSGLSLPLIARDEVVGALNLYARPRGAFGPQETRRAELFAGTAAGALALGLRLASYAALTGQLRESLASRAVIDQAVGVIMGQQRCSPDKAFAALRAASQNRNVKLRDVARELVAGITGADPEPPPFQA